MDLHPVRELYEKSLREHGPTPPGVGWRDCESQAMRFDRLISILDGDRDYSVADLGCGYGALYDYLVLRKAPFRRYVGYDISADMLAHAPQKLQRDCRARLVVGDTVAEPVDYVLASGIFNVRLDADEAGWADYVWRSVESMAEKTRKGFAFNLLTTFVDYREDHLYYADPGEYLNRCRARWPRAVLFHDYPLHEWTIAIWR